MRLLSCGQTNKRLFKLALEARHHEPSFDLHYCLSCLLPAHHCSSRATTVYGSNKRYEVAHDRSIPRWPHCRCDRGAWSAECVLHRREQRRGLEEHMFTPYPGRTFSIASDRV